MRMHCRGASRLAPANRVAERRHMVPTFPTPVEPTVNSQRLASLALRWYLKYVQLLREVSNPACVYS